MKEACGDVYDTRSIVRDGRRAARVTALPRSVGRYELLEEIGWGSTAVVYRARQIDLRRDVAVKELVSLRAPDPTLAQRFVSEARLAASLCHANVVTVFDLFEHAGIPYIAIEHLPHGSLRRYMRCLTLAHAARVFEGVLAGLAQAEVERIVHRDLKPENLLATGDGQVKIADFGTAKACGEAHREAPITATGMTIGTLAYMAPEQAMGDAIGPWTDLYALGVIAFEIFTGRVPFAATADPSAVMWRHILDPIPPVRSLNPEVPAGVSQWIERLLVKDPVARTACAATAWAELEDTIVELLGPCWRPQVPFTECGQTGPGPRPVGPVAAKPPSGERPASAMTNAAIDGSPGPTVRVVVRSAPNACSARSSCSAESPGCVAGVPDPDVRASPTRSPAPLRDGVPTAPRSPRQVAIPGIALLSYRAGRRDRDARWRE